MSEQVPARHERKYQLPLRALPALRGKLGALLRPDPHNLGPQGYAVRSLYFETWGQHFLREKLAGLHDRYKLRVRGYPPLLRSSPLVAEIKRKQGETVLKERAPLSADELDLLLAGRYAELLTPREQDAVLRRFVAARASLGAVVPLVVAYRRLAWEHPAPDVYLRLTIDHDFWALPQGEMFAARERGQRFGVGSAILEVKTAGTPPRWLGLLLREHGLDPLALSKFAFASGRTWTRSD